MLLALTSSALTLGAYQVFVAPVEPRVVAAVLTRGGSASEIESVLARLEVLLENQPPLLVGTGSLAGAPTNRRVAADQPNEQDDTLEILERLAAIERKLSVRPFVVRDPQPLDRLRAQDSHAIRAAIQLREVDRETFRFDIRMRTMHEIVERFGYPGETAACGNDSCEVYWRYEIPSADPENPNFLCLYFTGGLVMFTEARWTD